MNKLFCDVCHKEMNSYKVCVLKKKIGEIHTSAKVRGKGFCAHAVRSGKTIERYIYLYVTAEETGEYGGANNKIDVCEKCAKEMLIEE